MKYKVTHTTKYEYTQAVPVCHNLVHLAARALPYQSCSDFRLLIHPEPSDISHRRDSFGNRVSYFSVDQPHRGLTVTATSQVDVSDRPPVDTQTTEPWETVAENLRVDRSPPSLDAYQYVFPSPFVATFAALTEYARQSFSAGRPILQALLELTSRIHKDITYDARATTVHTPLTEVFQNRRGVCQDLAHLQTACLRSIGLAARYVSGYLRTQPPPGKPRLIGADASHAWLSVYCGQAGWIDVDPTNDVVASADHITLAWGRDYSDVCPIQGVIIGGGTPLLHVSVDVAPEQG
ncbi:MAG: transglutaminase family protein [Pirellulales bacterium]